MTRPSTPTKPLTLEQYVHVTHNQYIEQEIRGLERIRDVLLKQARIIDMEISGKRSRQSGLQLVCRECQESQEINELQVRNTSTMLVGRYGDRKVSVLSAAK